MSQNLTGRMGARPGGRIPNFCQRSSCSKAENVSRLKTHFLPETDNEDGAEVREEFRLFCASPPPRTAFTCFLLSFSPPFSVLFRSDFLARQERLQKMGEERGQLMEKIWGK